MLFAFSYSVMFLLTLSVTQAKSNFESLAVVCLLHQSMREPFHLQVFWLNVNPVNGAPERRKQITYFVLKESEKVAFRNVDVEKLGLLQLCFQRVERMFFLKKELIKRFFIVVHLQLELVRILLSQISTLLKRLKLSCNAALI